MMRKHKLKTSVCAIASTSLLLLSATAFNAAAHEEVSNNLSVPAIFAEGYGMTGLPAVDDKGSGLPGSSDPIFDGEVYCYPNEESINTEYYLQLDELNSWQADWSVADTPVSVTVDWSDDVIKKEWNDKSVIPIGVTLYTEIVMRSMWGYEMTDLPGDLPAGECTAEVADTSVFSTLEEEGEEVDVKWGTTPESYGVYEYDRATVFTVCAKLTIQELDENGDPVVNDKNEYVYILNSPVSTSFEELGKPDWLLATIDGEGKIDYLYNWNLALKQYGAHVDRSGTYRLTFSLEPEAKYIITKGNSDNIVIDTCLDPVKLNTSLAALDGSDITDADVVFDAVLSEDHLSTSVDIEISHLTTGE